MNAFVCRSGRAERGMTLMEVLAAVLILGLGLIMVAGAFPVAADQARRTVEATQAATLARSAVELCRREKYLRRLTVRQYTCDRGSVDNRVTLPIGGADSTWSKSAAEPTAPVVASPVPEPVWNPERWAYLDNFSDAKLWPPGGGDYVWQGFLTRVSGRSEAPLFRLTVVVIKYSNAAPDFYHPSQDVLLHRTASVKTISGTRTLVGTATDEFEKYSIDATKGRTDWNRVTDRTMVPGDYVMDPKTGFCYQVATKDSKQQVTLIRDPVQPLSPGTYFVFRNVVGIFYTLISE